jgi:hypothetical protein
MAITKATSSAVAPGAKGELVVGSATNDSAILSVGSASQVLTVDSSTATGLKWATPVAGGSLDYVLLNTGGTALSGTSTSVSFAAQKALWIFVQTCSSSAATAFYIKFNNSTTNLYGAVGVRQVSGAAATLSANNSEGQIEIGSIAAAGNNITTYMELFGTDKTGYKPGTRSGAPNATGTGSLGLSGNFINRDTAALTSMQIFLDSGTFDAGTVYIYGAA